MYNIHHIEGIIMPYSFAIVKLSLFYEGTYKTSVGYSRAAFLLFTVSCVHVLSDYCPRFNTKTGSIDVHLCPVDSTCPRQHYLSSTVYKCKHTVKNPQVCTSSVTKKTWDGGLPSKLFMTGELQICS